MRETDLDFGVVSGDEDFLLAVAVEIGDDRRREALGFVLDGVVVGEVHPCLTEGEVAFVLRNFYNKAKESIGEKWKNEVRERARVLGRT